VLAAAPVTKPGLKLIKKAGQDPAVDVMHIVKAEPSQVEKVSQKTIR
jgi:hypothetical protein